jgi:superfamily II DNA helicase RecQ
MQYKSPVVAIIGTEVDKSMLFILPASISSRVTIVVMLLVTLQFNIKKQYN